MSRRLPEGKTDEEFIEAWQTSESATQAAKQMGMTLQAVCSYADFLRRNHDIPLRKFPRGGPKRDYDHLREIATRLLPGDS